MKHPSIRIFLLVALLAASVQSVLPVVALAQDGSSGGDSSGSGGSDEGSWDGGTGGEGGCKSPLISKECRDDKLHLLAPLDDKTNEMEVSDVPLETFFTYFNMSWPWLLGVASGIAVLQAVWGGVLIMTSMDRDGGKEKIEWAVGGMVIIALAGFILRFLNSIYYA